MIAAPAPSGFGAAEPEGKHSIGDCVQGCSFTPWAKPAEQWCGMPKPHCLKPGIAGNRWAEQYLPFDENRWCAWWVRTGGGPWRLTFHQGHATKRWAASYDCLDVRTGERLEVEKSRQARRQAHRVPRPICRSWWTATTGALLGKWDTIAPGGAGYLLCAQRVEQWVREAVANGVAADRAAGQQMLLFQDA